jgi:cytochrome c556
MKLSRLILLSGCALAALTVFALSGRAEEKKATVKEVMKKLPGKEGIVPKAATLGKEEKWDDAAKLAKDIKEYGEALGKNKPKKGDAESWEKLTKKYAETTAAISTAIDKKDSKALADSAKTFGGMCKSCHDSHK